MRLVAAIASLILPILCAEGLPGTSSGSRTGRHGTGRVSARPADADCTPSRHLSRARAGRSEAPNRSIEFSLGGKTRFVMRRVGPPHSDGAVDFRILGERDAPAILSLIGAAGDHSYADYTYNGFDADLDVSHGGLNLRPLDGTGSVNIWSMTGHTKLRVGSRNFEQALDLWHSGRDSHIRSTRGNIIVESPFETKSAQKMISTHRRTCGSG